jgi:NADH-quinone oxidoreductase subunit C
MAKCEVLTQKLQALLSEGAVSRDDTYKAGVIFSVQVPLGKLKEAVQVCEQAQYYLESLTALDFQDTFELVYHMNCYEPKARAALRVLCGHDQSPATVSDIFPSALWQEREVQEFFGIRFAGSPDMRPLLMPEDADYYPLKKTFGMVHAYHKREEIYG